MRKLFWSLLVVSLLTAVTVHADIISNKVSNENEKIVISGTLDADAQFVALELLEDGYTFKDGIPDGVERKDAIPFLGQQELAAGVREFRFAFPCKGSSRKLNACLNGEGFSAPVYFTVNYIKDSDFQAVLAELKNNMASQDAFAAFLAKENHAMVLNCDTVPAGADADKVKEIVYNSLKEALADVKKSDDAKIMWEESILISLLNAKTVSDMREYGNYLDLSQSAVARWYNHALAQPGGTKKLANVLQQEKYTACREFETALKRALILTTVRYPDGAANIGAVLQDFSDVSNITAAGGTEKYKAFAGKDYTDYSKFKNDFETYKLPSSSGGSSGTPGKTSGSAIPITVSPSGGAQQTVDMKFIDLDTVPWAYKAIATLADQKIIAGRSETRFAPDDPITREEFAKLCVCVLSLENRAYQNHFRDAAPEDWYTKYVNIAYEAGICTGISEGSFGAGMTITRQDMAVMLYNSLKIQGFTANTAPAGFDDWEQISAYAQEAVSALVNYGAISGMGDNTFAPKATATRAQAAAMLFGVLNELR